MVVLVYLVISPEFRLPGDIYKLTTSHIACRWWWYIARHMLCMHARINEW